MIDHCKYVAQQTPSHIYDFKKFNKLTKPTIFQYKILPDKNAHIDKYKIKKSKFPDPGSYDGLKSFKRT